MKEILLPLFKETDKYLPKDSDVLFLGTGSSVMYNLNSVLDYIKNVNPIIIGINGYFHGINCMKGICIRKELYRPDSNMDLIPECISDLDYEKLIPNIMQTNYFFQGESHDPIGRVRDIKERGSKFSNKLSENLKDNIFHCNIILHKEQIIDKGIHICYPNKSKFTKKAYGSLSNWNYDKAKGFNLFPLRKKYCCKLTKLKKNIEKQGIRMSLNDLFGEDGIHFEVRTGGEYILSWLHYNNIKTIAICGIYDLYKVNSTNLIRNWFWCKPERLIHRYMISHQSILVDLYRQVYGDRFVNLNLNATK